MKHAIAAFSIFLFSSCAALTARNYDRGDTDEVQFRKDAAACEMEAEKAERSAVEYSTYNRVFDPCMRSKGYAKKH